MASLAEAFRGFLFAESEDLDSLFSDTCSQTREIAIRRHKAEAIAAAAVQKVHCVNNERDVGRIFPRRIGELLMWQYRVPRENIRPLLEAWAGKITIDSSHADVAVFCNFVE